MKSKNEKNFFEKMTLDSHNHEAIATLYTLLYCTLKALSEKGLLFPDEVKEMFYKRVIDVTENKEKSDKEMTDFINYILLQDENLK